MAGYIANPQSTSTSTTTSSAERATSQQHHGNSSHHVNGAVGRSRTGPSLMEPPRVVDAPASSSTTIEGEDDARVARFKRLYEKTEKEIASVFSRDGRTIKRRKLDEQGQYAGTKEVEKVPAGDSPVVVAPSKPARKIDEDDYDDYDDEDGEADKAKDGGVTNGNEQNGTAVTSNGSTMLKPDVATTRPASQGPPPAGTTAKSSDEVREKLQEDKKAAEEMAKRAYYKLIYTLENDRDAMLEQQKLDELDRQVDAEMAGQQGASGANTAAGTAPGAQHGKLSSANMGASSLTLKHLIARIDAKRHLVKATDAELRSLISEVRKNRSKWANEDKIGQEELYEAAEKVLSELKALTEHSQPFLTRVNKRDAPDYYNIIKHPMDLGTMTKKLKGHSYKSKQDFVDDLNIIWANCLKYNADPNHYMRKHALAMRKETDKLVPLIPDIVIRDRSEVEAEERRMQNGGMDVDGAEESDEEPIMSTRGRKAPSKTSRKGTNTARKTVGTRKQSSPVMERGGSLHRAGSMTSTNNLKVDLRRADSDATLDGGLNRLSTPPQGGLGGGSPSTVNGLSVGGGGGAARPASQADSTEATEGFGTSTNGLTGAAAPTTTTAIEDALMEDEEYKTWKQVTKKDRARVAAERHRLFKGDRINRDEPALIRTKATMRSWLRKHRQVMIENFGPDAAMMEAGNSTGDAAGGAGETLAEGMEGEEDNLLPDYYETMGGIPEVHPSLQWIEDADGNLRDVSERSLHLLPKGTFTQPPSILTKRMDANMKQLQDTRKVGSKISIIKQMQVQTQMYSGQFQKYDPEPLVEKDIEPTVISGMDPIHAPRVCRAALQRSIGKIFFHAGFEDYQPSAMDAMTDAATDFMMNLVRKMKMMRERPKKRATGTIKGKTKKKWIPRYTVEESVLHGLNECGMDVESLETYVKEDVERLGSKLGIMHERMKAHLAELLRPALANTSGDGADAFNDDSEQFVGGDFAEDLGEDYFGFKELGLDIEFGLAANSVPLHLLQNRMHNIATTTQSALLAPLPPYNPVTLQNLKSEIGLVQNFFLAKLHANNDEPLVEDDDLPQKQRLPKPRLPPTGKISSPRKRPAKEQGGGSKSKKRKIGDGGNVVGGGKKDVAAGGASVAGAGGGGAGDNGGSNNNNSNKIADGGINGVVAGETNGTGDGGTGAEGGANGTRGPGDDEGSSGPRGVGDGDGEAEIGGAGDGLRGNGDDGDAVGNREIDGGGAGAGVDGSRGTDGGGAGGGGGGGGGVEGGGEGGLISPESLV
ncbi:MAG: hypothetical protein M1823_002969 [Watsoniomyces obsoletus]|nr:MAG: hypothetical protein M1823_002969 [Watsoniomyces obsoletus]